jgi:hypothetical protein
MGKEVVSPLRQRMIEDMNARKLGKHSQRSHIHSCKRFAAFLKRSPETLIGTATLLAHHRLDLFGTVRDSAVETANVASVMLRRFNLEPPAAALDAAAAVLPGQNAAGRPNAAADFTVRLNALRDAIVHGLAAAWNDPAQLTALNQGSFKAALDALDAHATEQHLGPEEAAAPATAGVELGAALDRIPRQAAPAIAPKWTIVLEATPATVNVPVTATARLIVPTGSEQPEVTLTRYRAGVL